MGQQRMPEQKKLMLHVLLATLFPLAVFLIVVLTFAHHKQGLLYLLAGLAGSLALVASFMGVYHMLGTLFSLVVGVSGGIVLVLLYGAFYEHRALTMRGWGFIAGWLLAAALLGYWGLLRSARKTTARHPAVEKKRALRILLAGYIGVVAAGAIIMIYLAMLSNVLK
jgi:hypothetical protein